MSTPPSRHALVTGASTGIGAAFARRLARDGYALTLVARDQARLDALATELGGAAVMTADLSDAVARRRVEERIASDPPLDLLVNNAGFGTVGAFADLDVEREDQEVQLNILALMRLTHAALPGMVRAGRGAVINLSSVAGFNAGPRNATYCATKAFVTSFTEALSEELRDTGVKVQALCPGFTRTEFQERAQIDVSSLPSAVWMTAEAVVDAALDGLARGQVVCVPGALNQAIVGVTSLIPRAAMRRIGNVLSKRF